MPQLENKPLEDLKLEVSDLTERFETSQRPAQEPAEPLKMDDIKTNINTYGSWIYQGVQRTNSSVPTHSPKNREEQFYLYLNGATIRLYVWVSGTWRYATLT